MQPGEKLATLGARYKESGLDLCVDFSFLFFPFLIEFIQYGVLEVQAYGMTHTGPGSRSESKKRMTRYAMEQSKPLTVPSHLSLFPATGRQHLLSHFLSYLATKSSSNRL